MTDTCKHNRLHYASGGFHIYCTDCGGRWNWDRTNGKGDLPFVGTDMPFGADAVITNGPTNSLSDVINIINRDLPGWWWRCGTCYVSDDAAVGPDYNDPAHGERLLREFPTEFFDGTIDIADSPPKGQATALLKAYVEAKSMIDEYRATGKVTGVKDAGYNQLPRSGEDTNNNG